MPCPFTQKTFPFYGEHETLKQLAADLRPHVRKMVDKRCTKVLADLVVEIGHLECPLDELWQKLDAHCGSHRAEIDAADWWKHGGETM